jgi:hypothetical protein
MDNKRKILQFELNRAQNELANLADKQAELGQSMGEAMSQTSETWHDNSCAEIIAQDSRVLDLRGQTS